MHERSGLYPGTINIVCHLQNHVITINKQPVIWAISAWRAGDHAQLVALAEALKQAYGWVVDFKPVCDRRQDPASFGYGPPWPDGVIGIGRGGTHLGLWLKRASGEVSKFIQLGRLDGPMDDCDLIVTTAQYGFPDNPNHIRLTLPLTSSPASPQTSPPASPPTPEAQAGDAAIATWASRLTARPRPLIGVLVGGPSAPLQFGIDEGRRLVADLVALSRDNRGSLLITTGRRTPVEVVELLSDLVATAPDRHLLTVYPPEGFSRPEDNPYPAILEMADHFVVTADSVSMLADACLRGKPVTLFDLPERPEKLGFGEFWRRRRRRRFALGKSKDPIDWIYDAAIRRGWVRPGRDVPTLIAWLKRTGSVSGDPAAAPRMAKLLRAEHDTVLRRIYQILMGIDD